MKCSNLLLPVIAIAIWSCSGPESQPAEKTGETTPPASIPKTLAENLETHGYDTWRTFKSLSFTKVTETSTELHRIDLQNRKVLITTDNYQLGFDGQNVWVSPDREAFSGRSPRFYHNLWFYFFSLPYVMVDPGTYATTLESATLGNTEYQRIQISFGESVGDAPDDRYILYIHPQSKQLDLINYSVTFYDSTRAENYSALKYEQWQDIQGMKVPLRMIGYRWENDSLGEKRYDVLIEDPIFSIEPFDDDLFKIPKNAFVDR